MGSHNGPRVTCSLPPLLGSRPGPVSLYHFFPLKPAEILVEFLKLHGRSGALLDRFLLSSPRAPELPSCGLEQWFSVWRDLG